MQKKYKILITQTKWDGKRYFKEDSLRILSKKGEIAFNEKKEKITPDELAENIHGIDAIITGWGGCPMPPETFEKADKLKIIGVLGGGVGSYSPELAFSKGIKICHTPKAIGRYVAEFTMGLILSLCYDLNWHNTLVRKGKNKNIPESGGYNEKNGWLAKGLSRSTVGIIGSGSIARIMVEFLKPYMCNILMYDPFLTDKDASLLGVKKVELDDLLKTSEIVTVHAAWTKETEGMISKERISLLKDGAIFINSARMAIVDEKALAEEIKKGRIKAGLNLIPFNKEIWFDSELEDQKNLLVSSGYATVADKTLSDMGEMLTEDFARFFRGEKLLHEVRKEMLDKMT